MTHLNAHITCWKLAKRAMLWGLGCLKSPNSHEENPKVMILCAHCMIRLQLVEDESVGKFLVNVEATFWWFKYRVAVVFFGCRFRCFCRCRCYLFCVVAVAARLLVTTTSSWLLVSHVHLFCWWVCIKIMWQRPILFEIFPSWNHPHVLRTSETFWLHASPTF